jgi:NADH-quinone oxidoreductase subunit A
MIETFFIYALGVSAGVFLLYFLGVALAPYAPSEIKNEHFECGLPASSSTPKKANFGFFVYAIMFIVADMSALFVALFVYGVEKHSAIMASAFVLILAIAISLSMRELQKQEEEKKQC